MLSPMSKARRLAKLRSILQGLLSQEFNLSLREDFMSRDERIKFNALRDCRERLQGIIGRAEARPLQRRGIA